MFCPCLKSCMSTFSAGCSALSCYCGCGQQACWQKKRYPYVQQSLCRGNTTSQHEQDGALTALLHEGPSVCFLQWGQGDGLSIIQQLLWANMGPSFDVFISVIKVRLKIYLLWFNYEASSGGLPAKFEEPCNLVQMSWKKNNTPK